MGMTHPHATDVSDLLLFNQKSVFVGDTIYLSFLLIICERFLMSAFLELITPRFALTTFRQ